MDAEYAYHYTREVMLILIREFQSPDEEMKKIVLKVGQRSILCCNKSKFDNFEQFFCGTELENGFEKYKHSTTF